MCVQGVYLDSCQCADLDSVLILLLLITRAVSYLRVYHIHFIGPPLGKLFKDNFLGVSLLCRIFSAYQLDQDT